MLMKKSCRGRRKHNLGPGGAPSSSYSEGAHSSSTLMLDACCPPCPLLASTSRPCSVETPLSCRAWRGQAEILG